MHLSLGIQIHTRILRGYSNGNITTVSRGFLVGVRISLSTAGCGDVTAHENTAVVGTVSRVSEDVCPDSGVRT